MKKIQFMREKDISAVTDNISELMEKARKKEIQIIEPTLDEFKKVKNIILDYIKKEKRIIYGGFAWNSLIKNVEPNDAFYKDTDFSDVEFYSNKPIDDIVNLCNILYDAGFKYVQGKNAQHADTYKLFVNFTNYCDISYMPSNLFYSVMAENIHGLKLIHPKFIMIDILRQYNDPMTSYWRLDKNVKRGKLIMKHYPLELSTVPSNYSDINEKTSELLIDIFPKILMLNTILFIGSVAYDYYTNTSTKLTYNNKLIEVISSNLEKDVKLIYKLIVNYYSQHNMLNKFNDEIIYEQYHPFFQFTDSKAVFKQNGTIFLIIYGNNEKCVPFNEINFNFNDTKYQIKIGTFNVTFMYNLILFHQSVVDKNKEKQKLYDYIMYKMLESRNTFLDKHNKTILDETIYEDFKINCLGEPVSPIRKYLIMMNNRKLLPKSFITPYDPSEHRDNYSTDSYYFSNYSGNIINNPKDMIFNSKNEIVDDINITENK